MNELPTAVRSRIDAESLGDLVLQRGGRLVAALLVFVIGGRAALALTGWFGRAVGRADAGDTLIRLRRRLMSTLEANGVTIPCPQRDVHVVSNAAGNE